MKRLFIIAIFVIFCISLSAPAMAAEPHEYVFEIMPPVSMLDDYDFMPDPDVTGIYEGYLPEGVYYVDVVFPEGTDRFPYPVEVVYDLSAADIVYSEFRVYDEQGGSYDFTVAYIADDDNLTFLGIKYSIDSSFDQMLLEEGTYIKFVSVVETTLPSGEISDLIHADLFGSFLVCGTLVGLALFKGNRYV